MEQLFNPTKPFDPNLFKDFDTIAKDAVLRHLRCKRISAKNNPDKYGPDLVCQKDHYKFFMEVEVKRSWRGGLFKHKEIHIPLRKWKFAKHGTHIFFAVLNSRCSTAFIVRGDHVLNSEKKIVDNIYLKTEAFFAVPVAKGKFVKLLKTHCVGSKTSSPF